MIYLSDGAVIAAMILLLAGWLKHENPLNKSRKRMVWW